MGKHIKTTVLMICAALVCGFSTGDAKIFKIADYNVQNLFDLNRDGTEYPDYLPGGRSGWNREMLDIKLGNIATVIKDLDADIIALQEIESKTALMLLKERLRALHEDYPYSAIAEDSPSSVRCAVLSRFTVLKKEEIRAGGAGSRNILKLTIDIQGNPLILYVNHWKSKNGPESMRIAYARALAASIAALKDDTDFILAGDFNSDYDEYETFKDDKRLNDTGGITGINHILHTVKDDRLVDESVLTGQMGHLFLYNLWLELPVKRRWSVDFFGKKSSPDTFLLSRGLYDAKGIAYLDNSFDKFDPDYLFDGGTIYRWRQVRVRGRHLGHGYSDHLPVFAMFTTDPFRFAPSAKPCVSAVTPVSIAGLYRVKTGSVNYRVTGCAVIYKDRESAVIKQKDGRAIYVYQAADSLEIGRVYDLTVRSLNRHYGNLEITEVADIKPVGAAGDLSGYLIYDQVSDLSAPHFRNEVVGRLSGIYRDGRLFYGGKKSIKSIRLYFLKQAVLPKNNSRVEISHARIGYHYHPEIIIEKAGQVR